MVEGQGAIWDPLWEYVLDDYEADDVERKDRRPQKANRNPSLLDLAYIGDDESDYDHYDRRGWFEKRDDREDMDSSWGWKGRESKNEKYSKVHSWRRNQSTDVDDREDDSMWEIFVSPEEINGSFLTMESNKGNGRQKAINEKKTKKQGFLRRFRKQQEAEPNFQTSEYVNEETPKVTEMKTKDSKSVSKLNLNEGRRKPRKDKANGEVYDPFHMIFEAAEKLDPWASDSDSSQSSASDRTDHTDDDSAQTDVDANETRNEQKASGLKSAGQISVEERTPPSNFTEIRLTHMPGREGTSYDGLQPGGNSASLDGPAKLSKSRASPGQKIFDTASLATKSTCFTQASKESTKFQSILPFPAKDEEEPARPGWNRVACCSVKTHEKDGVNKLDIEDAHGVFPATRIIAKDSTEVSSILGQSADFVNGVMGIPSDKFLETKGPHSLYAYDYESNEHMDLVYSEFNQKPRSSLSVRNLGPPPALISSSSPDEVVVQVEVSRKAIIFLKKTLTPLHDF